MRDRGALFGERKYRKIRLLAPTSLAVRTCKTALGSCKPTDRARDPCRLVCAVVLRFASRGESQDASQATFSATNCAPREAVDGFDEVHGFRRLVHARPGCPVRRDENNARFGCLHQRVLRYALARLLWGLASRRIVQETPAGLSVRLFCVLRVGGIPRRIASDLCSHQLCTSKGSPRLDKVHGFRRLAHARPGCRIRKAESWRISSSATRRT